MTESTGRLVIISGPSGVGKSTIVAQLLRDSSLPLELSVSATTRAPRPGEVDGKEYHFLTNEEFEQHREADDFLECCEVFGIGQWYGTLRSQVAASLEAGKWVILEIDVEGAMKVIEKRPDAITIFVKQSLEEIERRLRHRDTETEETIQKRLSRAKHELSYTDRYQHTLVNETVEATVADIRQILEQTAQQ